MSISRAKFLLFLLPALAWGQGSELPKYTVSTLPAASSLPSYVVQVIDGANAADCSVGGGSVNVFCKSEGGLWLPQSPFQSLTTNGSGAATLSNGVLNVPVPPTINSVPALQLVTNNGSILQCSTNVNNVTGSGTNTQTVSLSITVGGTGCTGKSTTVAGDTIIIPVSQFATAGIGSMGSSSYSATDTQGNTYAVAVSTGCTSLCGGESAILYTTGGIIGGPDTITVSVTFNAQNPSWTVGTVNYIGIGVDEYQGLKIPVATAQSYVAGNDITGWTFSKIYSGDLLYVANQVHYSGSPTCTEPNYTNTQTNVGTAPFALFSLYAISQGTGWGGWHGNMNCTNYLSGNMVAADFLSATAGAVLPIAANTVMMNASGSANIPTAVQLPTCTSGADLYNTSTHAWSCVSLGTGGVSTLASGTVTVSTSSACSPASGCIYKLSNCGVNSSTAIGTLSVGTVTVGTSFVINSLSSTNTVATGDASKVCWKIN